MLGVTLHVCNGFLKLPFDGRPPAARVLAEWVRDGTFGADATGLAPDFAKRLNPELLQDEKEASHNLGQTYFVAVGPLSDGYVGELRSELQGRFPGFLGIIRFRRIAGSRRSQNRSISRVSLRCSYENVRLTLR